MAAAMVNVPEMVSWPRQQGRHLYPKLRGHSAFGINSLVLSCNSSRIFTIDYKSITKTKESERLIEVSN